MGAILDELRRYADTHLVYEEALMAEIGYPGLAEHRRRHAGWKAEALRFHARFQTRGGEICHDVFIMARKWWLGHIQGEDRRYVPYLPG
jgi:hemerythrin